MGKEQENEAEYDSDDSVVFVPYVKPKPPEIVLTDSDGEINASLPATTGEPVSAPKSKQNKSKKKAKAPSAAKNASQGVIPSQPESQVSDKQNAKKKKRKNKQALKKNKDATVGQLFVPDTLVYVQGDDSSNEARDGQTVRAAGQDVPATKVKKKKNTATATVPVVADHPVYKKPEAPKKKKRARADSSVDPEHAAAIDHFNFLVSLNLADDDVNPPKKKRAKKDKPAQAAAVVIENTATPASTMLPTNDENPVATDQSTVEKQSDVLKFSNRQSNGFVAVQLENSSKGRKRANITLASTPPAISDKGTEPAQPLTEKTTQIDLTKKNNATVEIDESSVDSVASINETITMEELNSVQTNLRLNIGNGKRTLTLDEIQVTQERRQANRPQMFNPSGTAFKRPSSPALSSAAKRKSSGSQDRYFVTGPTKKKHPAVGKKHHKVKPDTDDLPWEEGVEGKIEDRAFPTTWTPSMQLFYGKISIENINLENVWRNQGGNAQLWNVRSDLERMGMRSHQLRCNSCNSYGDHIARNCPQGKKEIICYMCGETKHNTKSLYNQSGKSKNPNGWRSAVTSCGKAMCLNCGMSTKKSQKFMQMCHQCSCLMKTRCWRCSVPGHDVTDCPDNWRSFHCVTTTQKLSDSASVSVVETVQYRPCSQQYCSNCAMKGHNYYNCASRRDLNVFYQPNNPKILAPPSPETLDPRLDTNSRSHGADRSSKSSTGPDKRTESRHQPRNEKANLASTSKSQKLQHGNKGAKDPSSRVGNPQSGNIVPTPQPSPNQSASERIMSSATGNALVQQAVHLLGRERNGKDKIKNDEKTKESRSNKPNAQENKSAAATSSQNSKIKVTSSQAYTCKMIPDCKNYNSLYCCKIPLASKEHAIICKLAEEHNLLDKLNSLYEENDVSISLLRGAPEFHVGGAQYYRARDRVVQLVSELRKNPYASMQTLFSELYTKNSCENIGSSPEMIEDDEIAEITPDQLAQQTASKPITVITIDDDDDELPPEAPLTNTVQPSTSTPAKKASDLPETVPIAVVKPNTELSSVAGYVFEKRVRKILCQASKTIAEDSSSQKATDSESDKPSSTSNTVSQPNSTPTVSKATANTSISIPTSVRTFTNAQPERKGQDSQRDSAQSHSATHSERRNSSSEVVSDKRRTRFSELFQPRDQAPLSSVKGPPDNYRSRHNSSEGYTRREKPSEVLYDRRRKPSDHFETIKYGGTNPINFRDIPPPQDRQNRTSSNHLPPSSYLPPHPSSNPWDGPGNNNNSPINNPYAQQYNPFAYPPNLQAQNWYPNPYANSPSNGTFQYDNYANMVVQNHDFYVPPPQYNDFSQNYTDNPYNDYDVRRNDYSHPRGRSSGYQRRPDGNYRRARGRSGPR